MAGIQGGAVLKETTRIPQVRSQVWRHCHPARKQSPLELTMQRSLLQNRYGGALWNHRGNLAGSDVINWPNPFLFLCVGTAGSILFPNSVLFSYFVKTSHPGFYSASIVLCCPDLSLQTFSWGPTQISFAAISHCFQFWTTRSQKDQDCIRIVSALAFQFIPTHYALIHTTQQTQTHRLPENTKSDRSAANDLQPALTSGLRDQPRTIPKP